MKKLTIILAGLLISILSFAQRHNADWLKSSVFYQIYPSSYMDSNGDGFGDIKGVESKLDYIKSVGVNAIWFNPVFKSAFQDGGYDVIDFYQVDPRFGTNTDLIEFVKAAHKSGMHVVMDLVAGHSSDKSAWFIQSKEKDANLQYSDYYIWASEKPADLTQAEATRWVEANAPRGKYYIKNYYDIQPALNYGYANPNPNRPWEQSVDAPGPQAVRQELKDIIAFWMDKGIDGFRVDLAASLVKNDADKSATIKLWQEMTTWFGKKFPEGVLIAEWFNPKLSIKAGFNIDFFRGGSLVSRGRGGDPNKSVYFDKGGLGTVNDWYETFLDQYNSTVKDGYMSSPTGNHDGNRLANVIRGDAEQLKVAMTYFLSLPGIPFIYYGDEIGMKFIEGMPDVEGSRNRSGARTPMQWDSNTNAGFSSAPADKIYLPLDPDPKRPTVAAEDKDPNSLLNYVRTLLQLRVTSEAMGNTGEWKLISDANKPYPLVYMRWNSSEKYIIAINPSDKKAESVFSSPGAAKAVLTIGNNLKSSYKIGKKGTDIVQLPPVSAAIFKLD
ncbi:MAG TPA: alpha-amylase family glycosyl hydrolase [Bacteroidales bacterium]|nr:alpha-amylase family glycosyl hydrolase [Bacteroidales bacterium]